MPLPSAFLPAALPLKLKLVKEQPHSQHSLSVVSGPVKAASALQTWGMMAVAAKGCEEL